MNDGQATNGQWTAAWIEQQRELLRGQAGEEAHALGARLLEIGRNYLRGLQQMGKGTGDASILASPFQLGEELLETWRNAWTTLDASQQSVSRAFADMLGRLPPVGIAREHTEAWRELAATQAQCQQLEQELRGVLLGVQADALTLLEARVRERQAANQPIAGYRDLYDLWVECAEQVFAKVAHSDAYGKLQAELGNASMRLRSHVQRVVEYGLRQLDLPTRSELNSVHQQLRAIKRELAGMRAASPPVRAKKKVTPRSRKAPAPRHRSP